MPDMPGNVARPPITRAWDNKVNASRQTRYQVALDLINEASLYEVYEKSDIGTAFEREHLRREFYADIPVTEVPASGLSTEELSMVQKMTRPFWEKANPEWRKLGNKEMILRQGRLEAIRIAEGLLLDSENREAPQVIDRRAMHEALLVSASEKSDNEPLKPIETFWLCAGHHFEVTVHDGVSQVTVFILTPSLPTWLLDEQKPILKRPGPMWTVGHCDELEWKHLGYYRKDQRKETIPALQAAYDVTSMLDPAELDLITFVNKHEA